jgi:predicted enzyme involved in methoxymalonyl-ACP biosynthesis
LDLNFRVNSNWDSKANNFQEVNSEVILNSIKVVTNNSTNKEAVIKIEEEEVIVVVAEEEVTKEVSKEVCQVKLIHSIKTSNRDLNSSNNLRDN